jgi:hypothetical protein
MTTITIKHDDDTYEITKHLDKPEAPTIVRYRHSANVHGQTVDFYDLEPKLQNKIINAMAKRH